MATKAIKGVDEEVWNRFKAQATGKGMEMSEYLGYVVEEAEKNETKKWWNDLLAFVEGHKSALTDEDVERMRAFRKRFRMRRLNEIRP